MATSFFNGEFFGGEFFNSSGPTPPPVVVAKTGTGGIDPSGYRRNIVKPTGLLHLPKGRKNVAQRIEDTRQAEAEVASKLKQEFLDASLELDVPSPAIAQMSVVQVQHEIMTLLHKKLRTEDEELMLIMLMVAVVV